MLFSLFMAMLRFMMSRGILPGGFFPMHLLGMTGRNLLVMGVMRVGSLHDTGCRTETEQG